jgi:type VI protein secretion system component VasF
MYFIVIIHALYLGTDLKVPLFRAIFIWANVILVVLMLLSMFFQIKSKLDRKRQQMLANENINAV